MKRALARLGFRLVRLSREERAHFGHAPAVRAGLTAELATQLRPDHPRLLELRRRYSDSELPMAVHTLWSESYRQGGLDLAAFRDDNVYIWQFRNVREDLRRKYYLYLTQVVARDRHNLLDSLREDGAFGCWTFEYEGHGTISRDLLDSVNELCFLDRHWNLFQRQDFDVLDIGAGYGRLAHRMTSAVPGLRRYCCVDAVPESTFLCEFYLRYRGCQDKTEVVPLDELARLEGRRFALAVAIHCLSEMSYAAIEGWLRLATACGVTSLLIVPNEADRLISFESDGSRRDFLPLLERHGFHLKVREPVLADPNVRELVGVRDHFYLFEREP